MHVGSFCFLDELRIVDNRVAVVNSVGSKKFHGGFNVSPMLTEFSGMNGDFETCLFGHLESFPEVFRFVIGFSIIDPESDRVIIRMFSHFFNEFNSRFRSVLAVDGRNRTSRDTITLHALSDTFVNSLAGFIIGHEMF